ncbi:MAG: DNA helicase RecQ [Candidatus Levyibacteriota bacterium]
MPDLQSTLQQYFGYSTFRPLQENIIDDILQKKDVFVLMPTGGGKSLCYQLPSLIQNGVTIVISPLISLMKDQVDGLVHNGVNAAYLNSSLGTQQQQEVLNRLHTNNLSLLYVAPERLVQNSFFALLKQIPINFFAIDEAHCISQWGHDFRPEYRQLDCLRRVFPDKALVALTATATPRVRTDIIERLNLQVTQVYQASFNRPNLTYRIVRKQDPFTQVSDYIARQNGGSGIIYCQSRKTVEQVANRLQTRGVKALPYHAGLPDAVKKQNQERFIHEDTDVIVATIAFGMGIDKPNVRYIIHYDLPRSIEHYYQETGRAGRDGLPSECLFLYSYGDKFFYERFVNDKQADEERLVAKAQLNRIIDYAQSKLCRRALLLQYFAEHYTQNNCASCDNCLSPKATFDGTILAQKILSCVYRTGQRFGVGHIVGVLAGSKEKNILHLGHEKLSTYGIIKDYDRSDIKTFIYELLQLGYLKQSDDQYVVLSLTEKSKAVLQKKENVVLTKPEERAIRTQELDDASKKDTRLFNLLRALRKQIADKQNVPPYIIFADTALKDMATYFPHTEEQFSHMYGVGEEKLKHYAKPFLKEIQTYCREYNLSPIVKYKNKKIKNFVAHSGTAEFTYELFKQGKTITAIAKQRGITEETIHRHLQQAYLQGNHINITTFVSPEKQEAIEKAFVTLGTYFLSPIKQALGEKYSYAEIRWVQTKLLKD